MPRPSGSACSRLATLVLVLALIYRPLGDYIAHIYSEP